MTRHSAVALQFRVGHFRRIGEAGQGRHLQTLAIRNRKGIRRRQRGYRAHDVLQPVAIGIGKPGRGAQRRDDQKKHGRAGAAAAPWLRLGRFLAVGSARVRDALSAACTSSLSEEEGWRAGELPAVRGPGADRCGACVRGGNTTMAGRQSGKPSRQSRSFGCRWPSSMNLASSASEIGPNCWPSRARYHCVDEAGADMSVTGAGLLPAFEVECAGCDCALAWLEIRILMPLGVNRPGRQRLKPPVCGQAKAVCGPFCAPGGRRQGSFAPVVGSAAGKL